MGDFLSSLFSPSSAGSRPSVSNGTVAPDPNAIEPELGDEDYNSDDDIGGNVPDISTEVGSRNFGKRKPFLSPMVLFGKNFPKTLKKTGNVSNSELNHGAEAEQTDDIDAETEALMHVKKKFFLNRLNKSKEVANYTHPNWLANGGSKYNIFNAQSGPKSIDDENNKINNDAINQRRVRSINVWPPNKATRSKGKVPGVTDWRYQSIAADNSVVSASSTSRTELQLNRE